MNTETTSTGSTLDWILFFVSTAIMIAMLIFMPQWFWLVLPFSCTYLVKAMGVM